jgi:hypothetical protein
MEVWRCEARIFRAMRKEDPGYGSGGGGGELISIYPAVLSLGDKYRVWFWIGKLRIGSRR